MTHTYFVTGIGTDVGKTVASAILTEALEADYWKPIQAGDLSNSDTHKVERWINNPETKFFDSAFNLKTPMSPHAAAEIDGVTLSKSKVKRPKTSKNLVIEGAGGLLVPISNTQTIADLISKKDRVVVVSRHYLGSINHTLLTIESLRAKGLEVFGIIFNGPSTKTTEDIITRMTKVPVIGRIENEPYIDSHVVKEYAEKFKNELK
jgi:dethiobiotin synthetase